MKETTVNWPKAIAPLIKKYKDEPFPLDAKNLYQMMVMVVLAARTNDKAVNAIAPELFKAFPTLAKLALAKPEDLHQYISKIISFRKKADWLTNTAKELKKDAAIPLKIDELIQLPGIGRKSANVIKRFAKAEVEGVMVDLHTIRVANRLGIGDSDDPKVLEKQLMEALPKDEWEAGMSMSFLGRGICRPTPECERCLMRKVCSYYQEIVKQ